MAARSSWEGYLKLNLVSVPVKAFSANTAGGGRIAFNQIHATCHRRIRYKKVCPIHGEVSNDEIVPGFEVSKGEYVLMDKKEMDKLKVEGDRAIRIDAFIEPKLIDPIYYAGRTYYLAPDGKLAQKSYAVIHKAMSERKRFAVAEIVFGSREQVVVIRPMGRMLAMSFVSYEDQIKPPSAFESEVPKVDVPARELKLAESLIDEVTEDKFDLGGYRDDYTDRLRKMIEARAAGKKVSAVNEEEEPEVINLMDALKKSLGRRRSVTPDGNGHPRRPGRRGKAATRRKAA
jgi:DNA end-binding protein Ku